MKRWKRRSLLGAAAVIGASVLVILLLHTRPARRLVSRTVVPYLETALDATVVIGELDYRLWAGHVVARDVEMQSRSSPWRLSVPEIRVDYRPAIGAAIVVRGPDARVDLSEGETEDTSSLASETLPLPPARLASLRVSDGSLTVLLGEGERLEAADVSVELARSSRGIEGTASSELTYRDGPRSLDVDLGSFRVSPRWSASGVELEDLRLERGESLVTASGTLRRDLAGSLDVEAEVDVAEAAPPSGPIRAGRATFSGRIDTSPFRLEGLLRSRDLELRELGAVSLEGRLEADATAVSLEETSVEVLGGRVRGELRYPLSEPRLIARVEAEDFDVAALASSLFPGSELPAVRSRVSGEARVSFEPAEPARTLEGEIDLHLAPARPSAPGVPLSGDVLISLAGERTTIRSDGLAFPDGRLRLDATVVGLETLGGTYRLELRSPRVLAALFPEAIPPSLEARATLQGRLSGSVAAPRASVAMTGEASLRERALSFDGEARASTDSISLERLTLEGDGVEASAAGRVDLDRFERSELRASVQRLSIDWLRPFLASALPEAVEDALGVSLASATGHIASEMEVRDGRVEIATFEGRFDDVLVEASATYELGSGTSTGRFTVGGLRIELPPLRASIPELRGRWSGPLTHPQGELAGSLRDVSIEGRALPDVRLRVDSDGESLSATLREEEQTEAMLSATTRLAPPYATRVEAELGALPLDTIAEAFTTDSTELVARGVAALEMELERPESLTYRVRVEQLVGSIFGIGGGAGAPFEMEGDLDSVALDELTLIGSDTAIGIGGRVPLGGEAEWSLRAVGAMRLELLNPALASLGVELEGATSLEVNVVGPMGSPELLGDVELREAGARWGDLNATEVQGRAVLDGGVLQLENLTGRTLEGGFRVDGRAPLSAGPWSQPAELDFRLMRLDLTRFVTDDPPGDAQILLAANGTLRADRPSLNAVSGSGEIFKVRAGAGGIDVENDRVARWTWSPGLLSLPSLHLVGGDTDVDVSSTVRWGESGAEIEARAEGVFDNFLLSPVLSPDRDLVITGLTALDIQVSYGAEGLSLAGTGSIRDNRLLVGDPPLMISNLSGELDLDANAVHLRNVTGDAGGGRITGGGSVRFDEASLASLRLEARAAGVRLDYPEGLRSEVAGSVVLDETDGSLVLSGELVLSRAAFTKNISLEEELLGSLAYIERSLDEPSLLDGIQLDVRARTEEDVVVQNNLAELRAAVIVHVTGTVAQPELSGRITTTEGELRLSSTVYEIENGRIELDSYPLEPARLEMTARTSVGGEDISVQLSGPVDDLNTTLSSSSPDLTQGDLASLLLTGRPLEELRQDSRAVLQEQMADYFVSSFTGFARSALGQALPFDQVAIEPTLVGRETDPGARLTLGKNLTEDLSVAYSVLLNNADNQIWIFEYLLPKRLQFRAIRDEENELTGSLSQRFRVDLHDRGAASASTRRQRIESVELAIASDELDPRIRAELAGKMGIDEGDVYDYWKVQERAGKLLAILRDQGYLNAVVEVIPRDEDSGRVNVTLRVDPGKRIEVSLSGENGDLREYLLEDWMPGFSARQRVDTLRARAARYLFARRYYTARVDVAVEEGSDADVVTIDVARGPRGKGIDFRFDGRTELSRDALLARLPPRESPELYDWLHDRSPRLRQSLRLAYAREGYLDAEIGEPETRFDESTGRLVVAIPVAEGVIHRAASVELSGGDPALHDELRSELQLRSGDVFRLPDFVQDRVRIASFYRREGFPQARVTGSLSRSEHDVLVEYVVDEGPRSRVGDVRIAGNVVTNPELIRRQLTFEEGAPMRRTELLESQRRLYELGIFRYADVRAQGAPENGETTVQDVTVDVRELSDIELDYGFRASTDEQYEVELAARAPNVFGRAYQLQLNSRVSQADQLYRAGIQVPFLGPIPWRTGVFLTREIIRSDPELEEIFVDRRWNVTFQQTRRLGDRLSAQWSYIYTRKATELKDPDPDFPFGTSTLNRARIVSSIIEDTRDSILQPTRGRFWNASFEIAPTQLASDVNFVKLYGQLSSFRMLTPSVVWGSSYRLGLGWTYADSTFLNFEDRFQAGGPNSVRGFSRNSLRAGELEGGKAVIVLNQELRFPLWRSLGGAVFYDAGNVYDEVSGIRPFELRHTAGLGVRYFAPFGLLRLDWARVLDPLEGEDRSRLLFSLGHAF